MISLRHLLLGGLAFGLVAASGIGHGALAQSVAENTATGGVSPQRLAAGEGDSAGPQAPTIKRGGGGFLNTKVIVGVLVAGATAVVLLEAAGDDDSIAPTTTTN